MLTTDWTLILMFPGGFSPNVNVPRSIWTQMLKFQALVLMLPAGLCNLPYSVFAENVSLDTLMTSLTLIVMFPGELSPNFNLTHSMFKIPQWVWHNKAGAGDSNAAPV